MADSSAAGSFLQETTSAVMDWGSNLGDGAVNEGEASNTAAGGGGEGRPLLQGTRASLIRQKIEQLLDEIGIKRQRDREMYEEIKKEMEAQLSVYLQSLEASIFGRHEAINQELEPILKELDESLQRIDKLEAEREEYRVALSSLLRGLEDPEV